MVQLTVLGFFLVGPIAWVFWTIAGYYAGYKQGQRAPRREGKHRNETPL